MTIPDLTLPLRTICAYCPTFDRTAPENQGASHGLCDVCAAKFDEAIDARERAK